MESHAETQEDTISRVIDALTNQISILSTQSTFEANKTNPSHQSLMETSTIILQLSRTINELLQLKTNLSIAKHSDLSELLLTGRRTK